MFTWAAFWQQVGFALPYVLMSSSCLVGGVLWGKLSERRAFRKYLATYHDEASKDYVKSLKDEVSKLKEKLSSCQEESSRRKACIKASLMLACKVSETLHGILS